jgi:hypothetical protein
MKFISRSLKLKLYYHTYIVQEGGDSLLLLKPSEKINHSVHR